MAVILGLMTFVVVTLVMVSGDRDKGFRGWYHGLPASTFWPVAIGIMIIEIALIFAILL